MQLRPLPSFAFQPPPEGRRRVLYGHAGVAGRRSAILAVFPGRGFRGSMSEKTNVTPRGISRRSALKTLGAGAGAAALLPFLSDEGLLAFAEVQRRARPASPKVVPQAKFATLQALVDAIIPADDRSPGAREARVAD